LLGTEERYSATGAAEVLIVNFDHEAARRIDAVAVQDLGAVGFPNTLRVGLNRKSEASILTANRC
jgi:hypothetical protein